MAAAAVAAPVPVQFAEHLGPTEVVVDNLQELLRRKREVEKNKSKYHLTEADASLLLTNANEYTFSDGQVILEEGHENLSVYRVKSGRVALSKNGVAFCEMAQGWWFGETLLLDNKKMDVIEASLIAKGPVTISEVNLPFVKKLFEADRPLALKFYRNLASKLSAIFFAVSGNLMSPCLVKMYQEQILSPSTSSGSLNSEGSSSSLSSSGSGDRGSGSGSGSGERSRRGSTSLPNSPSSISVTPARRILQCPNVPQASVEEANRKRRVSKRRSVTMQHIAFKVYTLESDGKGVRTARLKNKKIKLITEAFGFRHKTTIPFAKIRNIVRTSETSITIIFDPLKAKTLFFKISPELEEFYGLTQPLIETSTKLLQKSTPGTPLSHASDSPKPVSRLQLSTDNYLLPLSPHDDEEQRELDKDVIQSLATKLELKRGDIVLEEGDLFQRIYTLCKGTCEALKGDTQISVMKEGEVFGEGTLLHLRPVPVTIRVTSETASMLVIPAHKLNELMNSNPVVAVRVYKKVAQLVDNKIDKCFKNKLDMVLEAIKTRQTTETGAPITVCGGV